MEIARESPECFVIAGFLSLSRCDVRLRKREGTKRFAPARANTRESDRAMTPPLPFAVLPFGGGGGGG